MQGSALEELSRRLGVPTERVAGLIDRMCARLPLDRYYVFRAGDADRDREVATSPAVRTIAAFPSPDDGLAFAQRHGYNASAPLRPIQARDLLVLLLRDTGVGAVLFLRSDDGTSGSSSPGIEVTRGSLLEQMEAEPNVVPDLTAQTYDALQFGVDFARRGAFRAALAEAIEAVVASYRPPPGAFDPRPRSIAATGAVEAWLRAHGFPAARQRHWIDVRGGIVWGDAEELCEIDCGTQQRLLVQLLIYGDGERQFIGRVVVTS